MVALAQLCLCGRGLYNNLLESLPAGTFLGLTALSLLYVTLYFRVSFGMFDLDRSRDAWLDFGRGLNNNQLTSLPVGVFQGLTALTSLYVHRTFCAKFR